MKYRTYNIMVKSPSYHKPGDEVTIIQNIALTDKQLKQTVDNLVKTGAASVVPVEVK